MSCKNVTKKFGEFTAVNNLTLDIERGTCFGLLGPNGAGKSTLIRMFYGAMSRTSGDMKVLYEDPMVDARSIKKRLGVVTQENYLDESLSVIENMMIYATYAGLPIEKRESKVMELLKYMALDHKVKAPILSLSGGMKRRLAFVRALLNDPDLVILDEPTTGLDPAVRHLLWDKINELKSSGVTIILTTHYMDEAEQLCDELVIIDGGEIKVKDSPANLIKDHVPGYLAIVESKDPIKGVADKVWVGERLGGQQIRALSLDGLHEFISSNNLEPKIIRPTQLEDVFLEITGKELADDA